jgi:mycothiol synthase
MIEDALSRPALPAVPGLVFRPLAGPEDYAAIADVVNAGNAADLIEETASAAELANDFAHQTAFDPQADGLVVEAAGRLVGYAHVWVRLTDSGEGLYRHRGFLRPEWRRRGIGAALWRWAEARLRAIAADPASSWPRPPAGAPRCLEMVAEDTAPGKAALAERHGYQPVRYFFFMQRPNLDDLPAASLPAGLEWRPATPELQRAIWEAKEDAFAAHWGHTAKTESDYQAWAHSPLNEPGLWVVAWDPALGQIAGISLNAVNEGDNARYGFKRGWVSSLGVRAPWRRRGLGQALLVESLRRLQVRGMTEAVLGVDAENPTGALRLYRGVGFQVLNQDAVFRKPLA